MNNILQIRPAEMNFILRSSSHNDIVFEWIPYNQLDNIKKISKGDFATIYSAIWGDDPLYYDENIYTAYMPKKTVVLKCIHNSQNISNEFLNEV